MKKLFLAIRHGDLDEVKATLAKSPEVINEPAKAPPKKDIGQSPLQVAVKIGEFDIAYYLIEQGADVNFMEAEAEGVTWRTPILHDAIRTTLMSLCYRNTEESANGLELMRELLKRGADPNKQASNTFTALDECVARAHSILDNQIAYPSVQDITEKQLAAALDMLIEHGADFNEWSSHGHYAGEGKTNRELFLDEFKGEEDETAHTRKVMREYCQKRGLL